MLTHGINGPGINGVPRLVVEVMDLDDEVPHRSSEVHGLVREVQRLIGEVADFIDEVREVACEVADPMNEVPDLVHEVRDLVLDGDGTAIDGIMRPGPRPEPHPVGTHVVVLQHDLDLRVATPGIDQAGLVVSLVEMLDEPLFFQLAEYIFNQFSGVPGELGLQVDVALVRQNHD